MSGRQLGLRLGALGVKFGLPGGQLVGNAGRLRIDLRDGRLKLRGHVGQLRGARLLKLHFQLAALRHGGVVLRLGFVKLRLGLRQRLLRLRTLGVKLLLAAFLLRTPIGQLLRARVKLGLAAGKLRSGAGQLGRRIV